MFKKPEIKDPAQNFINAGKEEAPVVEAAVAPEVIKKGKPGRKPTGKKPFKYISLRVPPQVHESLLQYTFEHRDEKVSLNTYIIEATMEKMNKDGIL